MPDITAIAADGTQHVFPDNTDPAVVDRVMKQYAQSNQPFPGGPVPGTGRPSGEPPEVPLFVPPELSRAGRQVNPYAARAGGGALSSTLPPEGTVGEYSTAASLPIAGVTAGLGPTIGSAVGSVGASQGAKALGANEQWQQRAGIAGGVLGGGAVGAGKALFKLPVGDLIDAVHNPMGFALKAGKEFAKGATETPEAAPPKGTTFPGATSSETPIGNAKLPPPPSEPQATPQFVSKFTQPKPAPAPKPVKPEPPPPFPGATSSATTSGGPNPPPAKVASQPPPQFVSKFGPQEGGPQNAPNQLTGSAKQPFEPLIFSSEEEAAAHDQRMVNIERQAQSAGKYHAAQGAAGKKTNLQQRIGAKASISTIPAIGLVGAEFKKLGLYDLITPREQTTLDTMMNGPRWKDMDPEEKVSAVREILAR